jgi:hypothetical protein
MELSFCYAMDPVLPLECTIHEMENTRGLSWMKERMTALTDGRMLPNWGLNFGWNYHQHHDQ